MKRSLIYLDEENVRNGIDLLEVANQMYGDEAYETYAVTFNETCVEANQKFDYCIRIHDNRIVNCDMITITNIMEELHRRYAFDSILIPATHLGRMLAPRLAMRLHVGLVADVTAIHSNKGELEMVRPAFSGKIMAGIVNKGRTPVMMSVRQNVFSYEIKTLKETQEIEFQVDHLQPSRIKRLDVREKTKSKDIRESDILVSGGGGTHDHFHMLQSLADELGGQVAASRSIVDSGLASRSIQVGQSGKTVSPKLYIALGIYGSLHHIEGLKNVENIISVNTNKDAPICSLSDIVVEGDAVEFIEKLIEKIRKNKL